MSELAADVEGLQSACAQYGLHARLLRQFEEGSVNRHWLVEEDGVPLVVRAYVVRAYREGRTVHAVAFEHGALAHAEGKGWPVGVPLLASNGATTVQAGGRFWSVFPYLPGEPVPYESLPMKRVKGRLLARFHHDMADFPSREQRPGAGREWELDVFVQTAGHESFNQLLARFGRDYPELALGVRRARYQNLRELARLNYGETSSVPVHRDFHHDNLLFLEGELTGLLDFDLVRWDAAACDIGASLTLECLEAPGYDSIELRMARLFLDGYAEGRGI